MRYLIVRRVASWTGTLLVPAAIAVSSACFVRPADPGVAPDNTLITEAEIDSAHVYNAYDAIRRLRPEFLISRGKMSFNPNVPPALPNVYVDGMYYGDASTLLAITAGAIESIRFFNASEAQYRFGRGNMAGVIAVLTKH